jgi:hypothetical protein
MLDSIIDAANPAGLAPDEFTIDMLIERAKARGEVGDANRLRYRLREQLAARWRAGELTRRRVAIAGSPFAYRPAKKA